MNEVAYWLAVPQTPSRWQNFILVHLPESTARAHHAQILQGSKGAVRFGNLIKPAYNVTKISILDILYRLYMESPSSDRDSPVDSLSKYCAIQCGHFGTHSTTS